MRSDRLAYVVVAPLLALTLLALPGCSGAPSGDQRPSGKPGSGVDGGGSSSDSGGFGDSGGGSIDAAGSGDSGRDSGDGSSRGCTSSQVQCPLGCADLQTDVTNCGSCGYRCPSGPPGTTVACSSGVCVATCTAPLTNCGDPTTPICANLQTDADHCGDCDTECQGTGNGGTAVCSKGSCSVECPSGLSYCAAGGCVDTANDASFCGSSCVNCSAKATADGIPASNIESLSCNAGVCQASIIGTAKGGSSSGGTTCDALCNASFRVGCDASDAPISCPAGGCAFYNDINCEDEEYLSCTEIIPSTDPSCGALVNVECECSGTATL
jgi:hypothetical protein